MRIFRMLALSVLVALAGSLSGSWVAWATSFVERPFPEYVKDAAAIARGKVGMSYTEWGQGSDGTRRIYTYTELQVEEVIKGVLKPGPVVMRELGGQKDGVGMEVSGTAHFERGQDLVMMLGEANADGSRDVRGMMMGRFDIEKGQDGKEYLSGPALAAGAAHLHHSENDGARREPPRRWSLEDLRELVHGADTAPAPKESTMPVESVKSSPSPRAQVSQASATPRPEASGQPAPSLQSGADGEDDLSRRLMLLGIGVLLGGAVFLMTRRR